MYKNNMDDYTSNILFDSKNEWSILLMNSISQHIIDGFRSIFNESMELCQNNNEPDKYLMTYQNLLSRIPSWNQVMIENERERIITKSKCSYLEDLVTCVHIIQLKLLSCIRVSNENKQIKIDIPELSIFLHKVYINIARKLYLNVYLFEVDILPLEQQKRNREFELLVQTSIMNTIRDNLPIEIILRQYIDETQEIDIEKKEIIQENDNSSKSANIDNTNSSTSEIIKTEPNILENTFETNTNTNTFETNNEENTFETNTNTNTFETNNEENKFETNTNTNTFETNNEENTFETNTLEESLKPKIHFDPSIPSNEINIGEIISNDNLNIDSLDQEITIDDIDEIS